MQFKVISIMIIFLFLMSGLSGCNQYSNNDLNDFSNDELKDVKEDAKGIDKPELNMTDVNMTEEYKDSCEEIEILDLIDQTGKHTGNDIVCSGEIVDIETDGDYKIYKLSDEYFQEQDSIFFYQYGYTYLITDDFLNFSINDLIRVWGRVQDYYCNYNFNLDSYDSVYGVFIEKLYYKPNMSAEVEKEFFNNLGWKNPSFSEMKNFIITDKTDRKKYSTESDTHFVCYDFCNLMRENAIEKNYIIGSVTIYPPENESESISEVHAMVCFNTTDRGLYFVEPQTDEYFTKEEMDNMQSEGKYGSINFDHYTYRWMNWIDIDYEWDYLVGSWIIEYNNQTYNIKENETSYNNELGNDIDIENPIAVIETSIGTITIELFKDKVPDTVDNFISYANDGFYDGLVFHRVIDDFMIQGGGYFPDGSIKNGNDPINLEIHEDVRHVDGAIAMARTSDLNSATTQFYICDGTQTFLDDNYATFGVTIEGIDVVKDIASVQTTTKNGMQDWPVEDVIINSITIEE